MSILLRPHIGDRPKKPHHPNLAWYNEGFTEATYKEQWNSSEGLLTGTRATHR